ncbi:unnamed protein product [Somion occarium]|uniref:Uncharacterized protein n=1 Tax=Somion occarium TaxID=3059160 RepID=A0ABP1DI28_9APHY
MQPFSDLLKWEYLCVQNGFRTSRREQTMTSGTCEGSCSESEEISVESLREPWAEVLTSVGTPVYANHGDVLQEYEVEREL